MRRIETETMFKNTMFLLIIFERSEIEVVKRKRGTIDRLNIPNFDQWKSDFTYKVCVLFVYLKIMFFYWHFI